MYNMDKITKHSLYSKDITGYSNNSVVSLGVLEILIFIIGNTLQKIEQDCRAINKKRNKYDNNNI